LVRILPRVLLFFVLTFYLYIYSFSEVFFVDASDTTTIRRDLTSIAQVKNLGNSAEHALTWLQREYRNWLIIFNNADDPDLPLRDYLPQCTHANILITSRNAYLREELGPDAYQRISGMTPTDARELLLCGLNANTATDNERVAGAIVKVRLVIVLARHSPKHLLGTWIPGACNNSSEGLYSEVLPTG
jgi:hypothetical protein